MQTMQCAVDATCMIATSTVPAGGCARRAHMDSRLKRQLGGCPGGDHARGVHGAMNRRLRAAGGLPGRGPCARGVLSAPMDNCLKRQLGACPSGVHARGVDGLRHLAAVDAVDHEVGVDGRQLHALEEVAHLHPHTHGCVKISQQACLRPGPMLPERLRRRALQTRSGP